MISPELLRLAAAEGLRLEVINGADLDRELRRQMQPGLLPIIAGELDNREFLLEALEMEPLSAAELIDRSTRVQIPQELFRIAEAEAAAGREASREWVSGPDERLPTIETMDEAGSFRRLSPAEVRAELLRESDEPEIGEWPTEPQRIYEQPIVAHDLDGRLLKEVLVVLVPTTDATTVPAILKWGGWNSCPRPEIHVAVLRSWRDRFGAELIGLTRDCLELRVSDPPQSRELAFEVAKEVYAYCPDSIDQGSGTYAPVAAMLMGSQWFFWWD